MSAHLERASLLLAQSRPADAEREAMAALATQPDDPGALALLALSRTQQGKFPGALDAATQAVGLAPEYPYFHYVHALVLHHASKPKESFVAVQEALRLNPHEADYFSLLSAIELARGRWQESLEAAEQALALNAEHVEAANFRAMALVRLGRKDEAVETVDFALQRAPENAMSHANQGWNCLHKNDPKAAQVHFREALRLDPELDYARDGLMEALKARNPVYRGMLAYFMWIGRQSGKLQIAFVVGTLLLFQVVRRLADVHPAFWALVILFYLFIYLSWTAGPMFNLLLRLDKFGRYLLTPDKRTATNWFGAFFFSAIALFAVSWFIPQGIVGLVGSVMLLALTICIAATFNREGRNRVILGFASLCLFAVGAYACYMLFTGQRETALTYIGYFANGFLAFQIGSMFLRG